MYRPGIPGTAATESDSPFHLIKPLPPSRRRGRQAHRKRRRRAIAIELTTEQEVIVLTAVWKAIDDMVNFEIFAKFDTPAVDASLMFNTMTHRRLFNVLLGDFLSKPYKSGSAFPFGLPECPKTPYGSDRTMLHYIRLISDHPKLGDNANFIEEPRVKFANWLDATAEVPVVWLPSIHREIDMKIARIKLIKMCGALGKHNFTRLQGEVYEIQKVLLDNHVYIDEGQIYMLIDGLYEWFHTDVFSYHASTIAEFLNNLRWGLYNYLLPEFQRSFEQSGEFKYKFRFPGRIESPLERAMYWDLMNNVRSAPYFPIFTVSKYLKMRYRTALTAEFSWRIMFMICLVTVE